MYVFDSGTLVLKTRTKRSSTAGHESTYGTGNIAGSPTSIVSVLDYSNIRHSTRAHIRATMIALQQKNREPTLEFASMSARQHCPTTASQRNSTVQKSLDS